MPGETPQAMRWTSAQQAVLDAREAELLVSAAAGSGKTAVLVERVVRAATGEGGVAPVPLERLAAVTFTNAAAAELRARVHAKLSERLALALREGSETGILRDQLEALPQAGIDTIHGLCGQVLYRFGHLRGISASRQLDGQEAALILQELAGGLLDQRLGSAADPLSRVAMAWGGVEGIGAADPHLPGKGLRQPLLRLLDFMHGLVSPQAWYDACLARELSVEGPDSTDWAVAALWREFAQWRDATVAADTRLAAELGAGHPASQLMTILARRTAVLEELEPSRGWERLHAGLERLLEKQQDLKYKPTLLTAYRRDLEADPAWYTRLEGAFDALAREAKDWLALTATPWPQLAQCENEVRALLRVLWHTALELDAQYAQYKRDRSLRDFADLERGAFEVLCAGTEAGPDGAVRCIPASAALELRAHYLLVLVDEYQDTSPLQDAILDLLTPEPAGAGRPRIAVGDIKQSIYGFRQAEPGLFTAAGERLQALPPHLGRVLKLQGNFRSRRAVLSAINHFFTGLMTAELGGEDYAHNLLEPCCDYAAVFDAYGAEPVPDEPVRLHLLESTATAGDAAADDSGDDAGADSAAEETAADPVARFTAALVSGIVAAGDPVFDKQDGAVRPVQWRDIAVLLRTARGRVEALKQAFDEAGVPYHAPGRSGFYERPEVLDALSLLRVLDNPRDDVSLAAVLCGPGVQLEADQLLRIAQAGDPAGPGALWDRLQHCLAEGADAELTDRMLRFCAQLERWRGMARNAPLPVLLWQVYSDTGLLTAAAAQRGGGQRLANLHRLHGLAEQFACFDRQGVPRFLEFIASNRRMAGDWGEAPLAGGAEDAVRVMTVHQAKGLEFPVVVLPDLHRLFNRQDLRGDILWHRQAGIGARHYDWPSLERQDTLGLRAVKRAKQHGLVAEELRLLYVAMTRARERLELVAAVKPGWQDKLDRCADPAIAASALDWLKLRFHAELAQLTVGQPLRAASDAAWELGLHTTPAPAVVAPAPPVTSQVLADEARTIAQCLAWRYPFPGAAQLPAKFTVTRLAHQPPGSEADGAVDIDSRPAPGGDIELPLPAFIATSQPGAASVGTATHRLLACADFSQHASAAAIISLRDRLVEQGVLEPAAAARIDCSAVARAVADLAPYALSSGAVASRELPVALLVPAAEALPVQQGPQAVAPGDAVYLQGVIDLLIVTGSSALVVDYKTDHAGADALRSRYTQQLSWYARAAAMLLPGVSIRWAIYGLRQAGLVWP